MAKKAKWRRHDKEFKRQVVERMKTCQNITELAQELSVERKLLYCWKYQFEGRPEPRHADLSITAEERSENRLRKENERLKAALVEKVLENDFFRSALQKIEEKRQPGNGNGASASTRPSVRGRQSKAD
jgi:transposase-like protein